MLTKTEKKILEIVGKNLLVRKTELIEKLGKINGISTAIQKLKEQGYINTVEPIGGTCYVITSTGQKVLQSLNSEKF